MTFSWALISWLISFSHKHLIISRMLFDLNENWMWLGKLLSDTDKIYYMQAIEIRNARQKSLVHGILLIKFKSIYLVLWNRQNRSLKFEACQNNQHCRNSNNRRNSIWTHTVRRPLTCSSKHGCSCLLLGDLWNAERESSHHRSIQ